MKVYYFRATESYLDPLEIPKNGWVTKDDAEAEIEKARNKGYDCGYGEGWKNRKFGPEAEARAAERERIVSELSKKEEGSRYHSGSTWEGGFHQGVSECLDLIKSRSAQEPKPLERLTGLAFGDFRSMCERINAIVDAVNELRARK